MEANAPVVATPEVAPTPAPAPAPAPTPTPQYEDGGATYSITKGKMNVKDMFLTGLFIVVGFYGIWYYRKAIQKLDEQVSGDEFDVIAGRVDEMYANLKKALGKNYKTIN